MTVGPRRAGIAVGVAAAAGAVALFVVSRGRWSDPLIDSGREWIVPDALARGELLYRDVVYWFGPFTPYFQSAFFRVFGSGFGPLVAAGAASAVFTLAVLAGALRRVASRRAAAIGTALAVPALVFMPHAGGALLGMGYRIWHAAAFALAAVVLAARPARRPLASALLAGACAGLAGLCRTEWGLAAIAGAALAALVRARNRRQGIRAAGAAAGAGAAIMAAGLGIFIAASGTGAVVGDGHVLLTGLPSETRHFLMAFSGIADWRRGVPELLYSAAMWCGLFLAVAVAALPAGRRRAGLVGLAAALAVLAATLPFGGAGSAVLFSAAPLVGLAGLAAGLWRRRGSRAAVLAACGALALVLSYRRPFHIADSAYVAPPLLFALVAAAGLLRLGVARVRTAAARRRLARAWAATGAALVVAAFLLRAAQYAGIETEPIGGTAGMLSARAELAREIEQLAAEIRRRTPEDGTLAVFPEGEVLNLLAARRNPIRHKLYLPGYLTDDNEERVLAELVASPPSAIVVGRRPVSEYDRAQFGEDYGRRIQAWIGSRYDLTPFRAEGTPPRAHPRFVLGIRNP